MADFKKAFVITVISNEGGYNPGIGEKETYKGIDRGANPGWSGWMIIDAVKKANPGLNTGKMNLILSQNLSLQANIEAFYKLNYWNPLQLDLVNDQQLANNLFDCSVNQGCGRAARFMQIACNYVMEALKVSAGIKPLTVDGIVGKLTLSCFNNLPPAQLNTEINAEREASYRSDHGYAQWGKVWERRLIKYAA